MSECYKIYRWTGLPTVNNQTQTVTYEMEEAWTVTCSGQ